MTPREPYLRSFGRRKSRALSPRQTKLIGEALPRLRVDLDVAYDGFGLLFDAPVADLWLEIGFGAGEHLHWQAAHNPRVGLIGCEPYQNGVASLLGHLDRRPLPNVRIHDGDARQVLAWLPGAALGRIFLLHPDPWPKKRHHKRRLASPDTLGEFARVLKPRGELRFATDDLDYVAAMSEIVERQNLFAAETLERTPDDWPVTRYEQKALGEGRGSARLVLTRR